MRLPRPRRFCMARSRSLETHETDEDGTFSIGISPGAVAAAASAMNHFPHEIDLSNGVPSSGQFTLRTLRYFPRTLRGGGQDVVGASVRVCNLDTKRSIYGPSDSVLVALESRGASVTSPSGAGLSGVTVLVVSRTQAASTGVGGVLAE